MAAHSKVYRYKVRMVELTGESLGNGRYGNVQEAVIAGAKCAAKVIDERTFSLADTAELRLTHVEKGCERWSKLLHPNIVQFLGVHLESSIPILLMEVFPTDLHTLLKSPQRCVPLSLKISILHNVACGLAYLHGQIPQITHGHLSAKKVLIDSGAVAKISVGVCITVLPQRLEMSPYMPPEVTAETATCTVGIDTFSFGVLALFALSEELPDCILPPTYTDESNVLLARNELERRAKSMEIICSQFSQGHPIVQLITKCLDNLPESRPSTNEIQSLLRQAGIITPDPYQEKTKAHLLQEMTTLAKGHLHMKDEFEKHVLELRDQIRGHLEGMTKQRELLPRKEEELVSEDELPYIVKFLVGIQASKLGRELCVDETQLKIIDFDYAKKCDENMKRREVLTEWLRNCERPTWSALVNALSCIGHKRMANIISHNKDLQRNCAALSMCIPSKAEKSFEEAVTEEEKCTVSSAAVGQLESQLAEAKKAQERAESRLEETRKELEEKSQKCNELDEKLAKKEKELKIHKKAEERERKATAMEMNNLELKVEELMRKQK